MAPTKQTFWDIKKDFNLTKRHCYSWDPLDDSQKVSEYLIIICECMKPVPVGKCFDVGCHPQTITWHVFAVITTVNRTVQLD